MSSDCAPGSGTGTWKPERTLVGVLVKTAVLGAEVKDSDTVHCTLLKKYLKRRISVIYQSQVRFCVPKLKRVSY